MPSVKVLHRKFPGRWFPPVAIPISQGDGRFRHQKDTGDWREPESIAALLSPASGMNKAMCCACIVRLTRDDRIRRDKSISRHVPPAPLEQQTVGRTSLITSSEDLLLAPC